MSEEKVLVRGYGDEPEPPRAPIIAPDNLRSTAVGRWVDVIAEGEIEGLVNGLKSIYLNDTAVQNSDNSYNFFNLGFEIRAGTQAQAHLEYFANTENVVSVGTKVTVAAPVVRTITNSNFDRIEVVVYTPALYQQDTTTGDVSGTSLQYAVDLQPNGGSYSTVVTPTITGLTNDRYHEAVIVPLTGAAPWNVRVRRITADSGVGTLQNELWWDLYTEIITEKLRYPNTALIAGSADASQFSAIPRRSYDVKLLKVLIPSNYNPTTRVYTGIWDGTFSGTKQWTDNPAWCFYDLLTNTRYGAGKYVSAAAVDKFTLYTIAQYCDELVSNGKGGTEPRFTCNILLQTREEAMRVLSHIASIFRGMLYWGAGTVVPVQDAPGTSVALFTNANVVDGVFAWEGSALATRHTVALVQWNDPEDAYKQKIEVVEDVAGLARYGYRPTETVAVGTTSQSQARRVGKWALDSAQNQAEVGRWRCGLDQILSIRPGVLVDVMDQHRAGVRYGGRIIQATTTSITIDAPVTLTTGSTYTLACILPSGLKEERTVTNSHGEYTVITTAAFSAAPVPGAIWVLKSTSLQPIQVRVMGVSELGKTEWEITGLRHDPNKYTRVETGLVIPAQPTTTLAAVPGAISSITLSTYTIIKDSINRRVLRGVIADAQKKGDYRVELQKDSGPWNLLGQTSSKTIDVPDVVPGSWRMRVTVVFPNGQVSVPVISSPLTVSVGTDIAGGGITSFELANGSILDSKLTSRNNQNLIPNPNGEMGSAASGAVPEGNALVNDAANAYNGSWVRRITASAALQEIAVSSVIPAAPGESFYFEAWCKTSATLLTASSIRMKMVDTNGVVTATGNATAFTAAATYTKITVSDVIPSGYTGVQFFITHGGNASDAGKFIYFDALHAQVSQRPIALGGFSDNMLPGGSFELDTAGWVGAYSSQGNIARVNLGATAPDGDWVLQATNNGVNIGLISPAIPVRPGDRLNIRFRAQHSTGTGVYYVQVLERTSKPPSNNIVHLAGDPSLLGSLTTLVNAGTLPVTWTAHEYTYTVPAGQYYVGLSIQAITSNNGVLSVDAVEIRRVLELPQLESAIRASITSSFYHDFDDFSRWALKDGTANASILVEAGADDARYGGKFARLVGYQWYEWPDNLPYDPDVLYRVRAVVRQRVDPTVGGKQIFIGMSGVGADGVTYINTTGANSFSSQHYVAASGATLTAGTTYTTYEGYIKGLGTTPVSPSNVPTAPSVMRTGVRYFRPLIIANLSGGNGTVDITQFTVEAIHNPSAWIDTLNVRTNAITTHVSAAGSNVATSMTTYPTWTQAISTSITTTGGPVLIFTSCSLIGASASPSTKIVIWREIRRGATAIRAEYPVLDVGPHTDLQEHWYSEQVYDAPAAGTYTYSLQVAGQSSTPQYALPTIIAAELKR